MSKPKKRNPKAPGKKRRARAARAAGLKTRPVRAPQRRFKKAMRAVHGQAVCGRVANFGAGGAAICARFGKTWPPDLKTPLGQRPVGQPNVPRVPRLIQDQIDYLIAKGKTKGLRANEQAHLDEVLDYLDDLTILRLELAKRARN